MRDLALIVNQTDFDAEGVSEARALFARLYREARHAEARGLASAELARAALPEGLGWWSNLAMVERAAGELDRALSLHKSAAPFLAKCLDPLDRAKFHNGFALTYKLLYERDGGAEKLDRAREEYEGARFYYERAGHKKFTAIVENNIGSLLAKMGRPAEARAYLDRAQLLFNDLGERARAAEVEDTRALCYEAEGNLDEALECSRRAERTLRGFGESERGAWLQARATHNRIWAKVEERAGV